MSDMQASTRTMNWWILVAAAVVLVAAVIATGVSVIALILWDLVFASDMWALAVVLGFVTLILLMFDGMLLRRRRRLDDWQLEKAKQKYLEANAESEDAFRKYLGVFRERGESEARAEAKEADRKWKEVRKWGVALYKLKKRTWARYETT
jgi:type VI protein secretion system component VasK